MQSKKYFVIFVIKKANTAQYKVVKTKFCIPSIPDSIGENLKIIFIDYLELQIQYRFTRQLPL